MPIKLGAWHAHPHVRSGDQLTFGERAADALKARFGSWSFLGVLNFCFLGWIITNAITHQTLDPGLFYANLALSWLAAQQGGALQIASNRGDRIASEVALGTQRNSEQLLKLQKQQMTILEELRELRKNGTSASTGANPPA